MANVNELATADVPAPAETEQGTRTLLGLVPENQLPYVLPWKANQ